MTATPDDLATAIHESAHACVGLALGLPVQVASLNADGGGFVAFSVSPVEPAETRAWLAVRREEPPAMPAARVLEQILSTVAGPIAEARHRGVPFHRGDGGAWRDLFDAEHLIAAALSVPVTSRLVRELLAVVEAAAGDRVRELWPWIIATAATLVERREMTVDQVLACRSGQ